MKQNAKNQDKLKSEISPVADHLGFLVHFFFPLEVLRLEKSEKNWH